MDDLNNGNPKWVEAEAVDAQSKAQHASKENVVTLAQLEIRMNKGKKWHVICRGLLKQKKWLHGPPPCKLDGEISKPDLDPMQKVTRMRKQKILCSSCKRADLRNGH